MSYRKTNHCIISVIMPVYNSEEYVSEAILSILNQTFSDFEFIIVDDCSTDNTWNVIQSFSDKRIIVVRNEKNIGNYPSRNVGMKMARGKYIAVMDGDDIALPDRLWKQYHYMEDNPETLALGCQFDSLGAEYKIKKPISYERICVALLNNNCFLHPSLLMRSDVVKQLGGYDEKYIYSSDYDLVCQLSLIGKIENLPNTCMLYRWHPEQITQRKASMQNDFANDIRQKYQINFINKNKPENFPEVGIPETGHPIIGQIIGLYTITKLSESYKEEADNLLNLVIDNINTYTALCFKNGLLGIGMGFIYLLRNGLVAGDEDDILESVDKIVFNVILCIENNPDFDSSEIFFYLKKRVSMQNREDLSVQSRIEKNITQLIRIHEKYKILSHELNNKKITVILTVWKRNHLEEQIKALLSQSKPPSEIWVQQTQRHVDIDDIIEKYNDKVRYFYYKENRGVFGRFESVLNVETEYVFIIDDDIIPGKRFVEIALNKSCKLNAIISPNGRILNTETSLTDKFIGDGNTFQHSFCIDDTPVDFGNNAWFFKTEWIKYFLQYPPLYRNNGEDIHLSASLKLLNNIDTYVLRQWIPDESGNIRRSYSADEHALHKRPDFQNERIKVVQQFRNAGWILQKE